MLFLKMKINFAGILSFNRLLKSWSRGNYKDKGPPWIRPCFERPLCFMIFKTVTSYEYVGTSEGKASLM